MGVSLGELALPRVPLTGAFATPQVLDDLRKHSALDQTMIKAHRYRGNQLA